MRHAAAIVLLTGTLAFALAGRITSAGDARVIQFALKLLF